MLVTTATPALAPHMDVVFGAMRCDGTSRGAWSAETLCVDDSGPAVSPRTVFFNRAPICRLGGEDRLPMLLESLLTDYAAQRTARHLVLHAAVLRWNARTVLLPGERGSGKSTCALTLAQAGATYGGDDHAFVRLEDGRVAAFPKAVTLKAGSFALFPEAPTREDPLRGAVRHVVPRPLLFPWDDPQAADLLLFPQYRPEGPQEVRRLDRNWVALALVQQCFGGLEGSARKAEALRRLADIPAWLVAFRAPGEFLDGAGQAMESG